MALHALVEELLQAQAARIQATGLQVENRIPAELHASGERFLLRQAIANLLDNALDFTPPGGLLRFRAALVDGAVQLSLFNQGEAIPDYALARLSERFYSLPRPGSGRKSTGLGLNFVQEVAGLHGGQLHIGNCPGGVEASLTLPAA
ncbi:Sensor protein CreC [compost metagenome]